MNEPTTPATSKIRDALYYCYNDDELRVLCTDLGIEYEDVKGDTRQIRVIELIGYLQRRGRVQDLIAICSRQRPHVNWNELLKASSSTVQAGAPSKTTALRSRLVFVGGVSVAGLIIGAILMATGILTIVQPVKVTPTVEDKTVSIEKVPFKVFAYGGDNDPNVGKGSGSLTAVRNGISGTEYYLDYFLPNEGDGYAGLALRFLDSQDWTAYEFVEVTISFEDGQASCDFGVRDIAGKIGYVRLGGSSPSNNIALTVSGKQQTAKIPLAVNFESINRKIVYELIFNTDSYFTRGHHTFKVSSIKLLKP